MFHFFSWIVMSFPTIFINMYTTPTLRIIKTCSNLNWVKRNWGSPSDLLSVFVSSPFLAGCSGLSDWEWHINWHIGHTNLDLVAGTPGACAVLETESERYLVSSTGDSNSVSQTENYSSEQANMEFNLEVKEFSYPIFNHYQDRKEKVRVTLGKH